MSNVLGITPDEVKDRYEGTIDESQERWFSKTVDRAVRKLIQVAPGIEDRIASGVLDPEFVRDKVADAVLRVVRNPEGFDREAEGDYSYQMNKLVASGNLWYPESDLAELGFAVSTNTTPKTVFSRPTIFGGYS